MVDPLGTPSTAPPGGQRRGDALERKAPAIFERAHVHLPLYTGVLAVDAMFAIGRGQRELILGDDGTGKTSLALDVMIRQAKTGVVGVWVAIGRRRAEVWQVVEALRRAGGRWVVVAAFEDQSPAYATSRPTPARRCRSTSRGAASTRWWSTTSSPRTPWRGGSCRCCCGVRRAERPTPAMSSTSTRGCSSGRRSSRRSSAGDR
ncbi:MAG: hypothetical protein R3A48_03665 [Polyangiales bacterium]